MQFRRSPSRDVCQSFTKGRPMKIQSVILVLIAVMFLFAGTASAQQAKTEHRVRNIVLGRGDRGEPGRGKEASATVIKNVLTNTEIPEDLTSFKDDVAATK